jgi:hypothetical protein
MIIAIPHDAITALGPVVTHSASNHLPHHKHAGHQAQHELGCGFCDKHSNL